MINKNINTFKYFSQKILPLVYDDSLSYYEVLSKLTLKVNEIIENVNDNFKGFIVSHFNELMVNAIYDEETETITLVNKLIGDGEHTYEADSRTMKIE